ncbi:MAG: T9SS type A sorting domain-containing protein [Bacteroidales bacterium]|nr:T9SS type A sorting domain-containing protein [Bacteroidales bacterium]
MRKYFALLALCMLVSSVLVAQTENTPQPFSFSQKGISQAIDVNIMPQTDNDALIQEDAKRQDKSLPLRAGIGYSVAKTLDNSGRKDVMEDGSILWRSKFVSEGAIMTYLVFDQFNIPKEAKLFIYSPDQTQVFGPYTNDDVQSVGKLVTDDIEGDEVIVEYYEPANASFKGEFQIAAIMHVYRDFLHKQSDLKGPHGEAEGTCHIDVACPEAQPWRNPVKSVVCISITAYVPEEGGWGMYLCSGAMVNNVRMDKTPYVLSAEHCVAADDQTHKFYFNYQLNECNGTTGISAWNANGGTIVARSGASYVANKSDFLLLKITGNLGIMYRDSIVFAGWDRSGAASLGAGIHHPGGDWKKISFPKTVSTITSGNMANKYFKVNWQTNPNKGVTEQGSSGSPLFNANQLIIGTLTSGASACDYIYGADNYGRMYYHWTNNNASNAANKLQPWLDPDNTGVTTLPSMKYNGNVIASITDPAKASNFEIYPNPTQDGRITIQGEFLPEQAICNIYNVLGQMVKSVNVMTDATFSLNVNELDNGVYFVDILGSERSYRSKLIISR